MDGMNMVVLAGNVGQDGELNGRVLKFSLATSEKWKDKNTGQMREETQWHRCVVFGPRAESLATHITKGCQLVVQGKIRYSKYEHQGVQKQSTDIVVDKLSFCGGNRGSSGVGPRRSQSEDDGFVDDRLVDDRLVDNRYVPF